ncbi:peptidoglycan-binding protein [Alicyclobacillus fastidiosus]|uniref:Peptidoglycan-binding protein n=1 Tax=Alicyclobacillus fastidiosus TaxID=392011 RepID=A0ABV5AHV5_9BACL|nr:peptidoglycan-binding protein [Alicyclobacillus fastidiosus]WEH12053.1 peptidoglycan-binding protein [Alicyclobacillus fastidiosus]
MILTVSATGLLCVLPSLVSAETSSQSQPHQQAAAYQTLALKPVLNYPGHLIQYRDTGVYVKEVQQELSEEGYNIGTADGDFGPKTLAGVKEFQKAHGLTVDGIVGPQTWNALFTKSVSGNPTPQNSSYSYPGHLIEYGDTGVYVKEVQQQLNQVGDNIGNVDGDFGPKTLAGIKNFQKAHGLTADGIVGPETWNTLFNSGAGTSVASEVALIKGKGYSVNSATPNASVQTNSGDTLTAWIGVARQGDGHNQFVFFFLNGKYLGTDTAKPSAEITSAKPAGTGSIAVTYPVYKKNDSYANPTGVPDTITYHWNGSRLIPNKPYPKQFS